MKLLFSHYSKKVFVLALLITVAACSVKTIYNQLDYIIPSYVEGLVSLDSFLEEKVEQRTLVLINWHRNTQLHQYAEWLRSVQRDANNVITEEKILQHIATLDKFWKSLSSKLNQEMVKLLPLLNTEQRNELFSSVEDKNDEFREDYVDVKNKERVQQYTDRIKDSFETWLGDLTDEQEYAIKIAAAKMQAPAALRLERRKIWQKSIKRIIDNEDSGGQKEASLSQFFEKFNSEDSHALDAIDKINRKILAQLTVQIINSMGKDQKVHFITTTDDYIRIFTELVEKR